MIVRKNFLLAPKKFRVVRENRPGAQKKFRVVRENLPGGQKKFRVVRENLPVARINFGAGMEEKLKDTTLRREEGMECWRRPERLKAASRKVVHGELSMTRKRAG